MRLGRGYVHRAKYDHIVFKIIEFSECGGLGGDVIGKLEYGFNSGILLVVLVVDRLNCDPLRLRELA